MSSWWNGSYGSWGSSSGWWSKNAWNSWCSRNKAAALQEKLNQKFAELQLESAGLPQPSFAQVVASGRPTHDGSPEAIAARKVRAEKLTSLARLRTQLGEDDPARAHVDAAIAAMRRPKEVEDSTPEGLLGQATLLAARLQVKKDTALEQLQKAQEHVTKVEEELKEAQADLGRARELVASSSASVQSAPQSAPAESPGSDQLNGVRDVLSQLAASGFRIAPGQEGLATALDQLWGLTGPPPDVTMSPLF